MPQRIIIDTDPGQDDAVAILLAFASPEEIEVLGITAVAGNVPLNLTALNARKVCELAGRPDVPVCAGCDRPLRKPLVTAEHVHGKTGLDGPDLPEPTMPVQAQHGVEFIIDTLRNEPEGTVTLCPLGPLTVQLFLPQMDSDRIRQEWPVKTQLHLIAFGIFLQ